MIKILLVVKDCPWPGGYSNATISGWMPGEVREISKGDADYLLSTFAGHFVKAPPSAEVTPTAPKAA